MRQLRVPLREILDTAPPFDIVLNVRRVAENMPGLAGLDKCNIRKVGFRTYVDLHVLVDGRMLVTWDRRIAHEVEDSILTFELDPLVDRNAKSRQVDVGDENSILAKAGIDSQQIS